MFNIIICYIRNSIVYKMIDEDLWCNYSGMLSPLAYTQEKNENKVMNKEETYSIPIYENGVETEWSVDGIVGDEKYQQLISMSPEGKLPELINVNVKKDGK